MFGNWVNPIELVYFLRKLRRDSSFLGRFTSTLTRNESARVRESWSRIERPGNWWDIPAVQRRWNVMITGDQAKSHCQYVAEKYLVNRTRLQALSLGCGDGAKEKQWFDTGRFAQIDAYDLSAEAIKEAESSIRETKYADGIRYRAADVYQLELPQTHYDLVFFEHSLHHFSPLEPLLNRVAHAMKPDGLLVANEFVGPSRFQWTDRQLEIINGLLSVFPKQYLRLWNSPLPRLPAWRPSKLSMWLSDPSEAVESSKIIPLLHKHFSIVEQRGYGGAVLHQLLAGIAQHFVSPDPHAQRLLQSCFEVEDLLLSTHDIEHDFALIILRSK